VAQRAAHKELQLLHVHLAARDGQVHQLRPLVRRRGGLLLRQGRWAIKMCHGKQKEQGTQVLREKLLAPRVRGIMAKARGLPQ